MSRPTISDFFCGAGGSSTGLMAAGFDVRLAVNHWARAIETHSTNHPHAEHDLSDIQATHPSRYGATDVLWMSPSCVSHSIAKGKKRPSGQLDLWRETGVDPAEERSRATMREVIEYTAYHRYCYVIVENVVDVTRWQHYRRWWDAMTDLGYEGRVLWLNSMFFGVPQSRDRFYAVFWRRDCQAPNLDFRPPAWCGKCESAVAAVQVFKKAPHWGRYKAQYTYRCPSCGGQVMPPAPPAASIIDWSDIGTPIAGRKTPLKEKTLERIRAGLRRFARPLIVPLRGTAIATSPADPVSTVIASAQQHALILSYMNQATPPRSADEPLYTVAGGHTPSLAIPPFVVDTRFTHSDSPREYPVSGVTPTLTSQPSHGLTIPPFGVSYYSREDAQFDMNAAIPTLTGDPRHGLCLPMLTSFYSSGDGQPRLVSDPVPTVMGENHHGLVSPAFLSSYYGNGQNTSVYEPVNTITGLDRHSLVMPPLDGAALEEVLMASHFRMLRNDELKLAMSFPQTYIITGNEREKTKQIGNAVVCEVARWIGERVLEAMVS